MVVAVSVTTVPSPTEVALAVSPVRQTPPPVQLLVGVLVGRSVPIIATTALLTPPLLGCNPLTIGDMVAGTEVWPAKG